MAKKLFSHFWDNASGPGGKTVVLIWTTAILLIAYIILSEWIFPWLWKGFGLIKIGLVILFFICLFLLPFSPNTAQALINFLVFLWEKAFYPAGKTLVNDLVIGAKPKKKKKENDQEEGADE